jgi:hypothetical protein
MGARDRDAALPSRPVAIARSRRDRSTWVVTADRVMSTREEHRAIYGWHHDGPTLRDVAGGLGGDYHLRAAAFGGELISGAVVVEVGTTSHVVLVIDEMLIRESIPDSTRGYQAFELPALASAVQLVGPGQLAIGHSDGRVGLYRVTGSWFHVVNGYIAIHPKMARRTDRGLQPRRVELACEALLGPTAPAHAMAFHRGDLAIASDATLIRIAIDDGKGWSRTLPSAIRSIAVVPHTGFDAIAVATEDAICFVDRETGAVRAVLPYRGVVALACDVDPSGQWENDWARFLIVADRTGTITRLRLDDVKLDDMKQDREVSPIALARTDVPRPPTPDPEPGGALAALKRWWSTR